MGAKQAVRSALGCGFWVMWAVAACAQTGLNASTAPSIADSAAWSVFVGTGLRSNLADIVPHALKGKLVTEPDRMVGLLWRPQAARWQAWGLQQGLEWGLHRHSGLSSVTEMTGAWRLGGALGTVGNVQMGWASGFGVSLTSGFPAYDGAGVADKTQLRRALFYFSPEVTLRPEGASSWEMSLRVHHRCGVYGVVAPSKVGSNHLGWVGNFRY